MLIVFTLPWDWFQQALVYSQILSDIGAAKSKLGVRFLGGEMNLETERIWFSKILFQINAIFS